MLVSLKAPAEKASGAQGQELVYFTWRGAQVARSWRKPDNPKTAYQVGVRAILSTLTKGWAALSDADRETWDDYAAENLIVDRLGRLVKSTALGVYVSFNSMLVLSGGSASDTAPSGSGPSPLTGVTIVDSGANDSIEATITHGYTTLTGLKLVLKLSPVSTQAIKADPRKMHLCGAAAADSFIALPASAANAEFTPLRDIIDNGDRFIAAYQIMDDAGRVSIPYLDNFAQIVS